MKVTISLPNDLLQWAEAEAKKRRISRSQLYAQAITDFLARLSSQNITDQLNQLYSNTRAELDPELQNIQMTLLRHIQW